MDIGTLEKLMRDKKVTNAGAFAEKMRLIWDNAIRYNGIHSVVGAYAHKLSVLFEALFVSVAFCYSFCRMKPILDSDATSPKNIRVEDLRAQLDQATR